MNFWISVRISGFQTGFLDFNWISADSVRDFFRDGPLAFRLNKQTRDLNHAHSLTGMQ